VNYHTIIVLADGETWTTANMCSIITIDDEQFSDLCEDRISTNDLKPMTEIVLKEFNNG
jgi:hypothetical protein